LVLEDFTKSYDSLVLFEVIFMVTLLNLITKIEDPLQEGESLVSQGFVVSAVKGENPELMVNEAIDLLGGIARFIDSGDIVLIKPNVCGGVPGKIGTFTAPQVIAAIIKLVAKKASRVIVGEADSCMYLADKMLWETGILETAHKLGAETINLSKGEMVTVKAPDAYVLREFKINKIVTECDKIVSAPVMKTHACTGVTLNLKNMFGVLPERKKSKYHPQLDHVIVDVTKIFPPNLCIVDATVGLEGDGPFKGEQIRLGLIVAGNNPVATDSFAATIMGYEPTTITHLQLASKKGIGTTDLNLIEKRGKRLEEIKTKFKRARTTTADRLLCRLSSELGYWAIHQFYELAVKEWKKIQQKRLKVSN
jgi:uncharacterized protein (DUF362 family)